MEATYKGIRFRVINIDPGRGVYCDICGDDFTDSPASGGFLFRSNAYCPSCAEKWLPEIKKYQEEHFIRGHCPEGVSFADWVRSLR